MIYTIPSLTGQNINSKMVLNLVRSNTNIVGIKASIDSINYINAIILEVKKEFPSFSVLTGQDSHLLNTLLLGGDGAVPGTANFAPQLSVELFNSYKRKELEEAEKLQRKIIDLTTI